MAFLNICGFETGNSSEAAGQAGTWSVQTTVKRTGAYALRVNPTASASYLGFYSCALGGSSNTLSGTSFYETVYFRIATTASANNSPIVRVGAGASNIIEVCLNIDRSLNISGATTSSNTSVLALDTWYRLDITAIRNGACSLSVDGGTAVTCTGNDFAAVAVYCGSRVTTVTYDVYFDDLALSNSALPGAGQVNILKPNATGTYTAWTGGAGTAPTNVAEVPHDSDTSYISSSSSGQAETVALDSAATGGVGGTISTVKTCAIVRNGGAPSSISIRTRSGTTDVDTTGEDPGSSYVLFTKMSDTDPATSAAWTMGGIDALEIGVLDHGGTLRCTALYAMVWNTGNTAPTITAGPTTTYQSGTSTYNGNTWGVTFTAHDAEQTGANALTYYIRTSATFGAGTQVATGTCTSDSSKVVTGLLYNSSGVVNGSQTLYLHISDGTLNTVTAGSFTLFRTDAASLTLSSSAGVSSSSLAVLTAPTKLTLSQATGVSTVTLSSILAPSLVVPSMASGVGSGALALNSPSLLALSQGAGIASATLVLTAGGGVLTPQAANGIATAILSLSTRPLLTLGVSAGLASTQLSLSAPVLLVLSQSAGASSAQLAIFSPALLSLLAAHGVGAGSLTVSSPALFTLIAAGIASGSLASVSSPAGLGALNASGMSTAQLTELSIRYFRAIMRGAGVTFTHTHGASTTSQTKPSVGTVVSGRIQAGSVS